MNKKPKIIITDFINDNLEPEKALLDGRADIQALDALSESELQGRVEDADVLIVYHCLRVSQATIRQLKNCKLIVRAGVGIDNVDHQYAASKSIPMVNIPDYGSEDVADTAMSMLLSLMRGTHGLNSRLRADIGPWSFTQVQPLHRLRGCKLGIVGLGRIGTAMALRAKAFGMDVAFYDPYKADGYEKALGIRREENLATLLSSSDAVSLHCPLTPKTKHLINANTLSLMKQGAYLINTARGAVVDTSAIPRVLETGQLRGAGIDVLENEPPGKDDPIIKAWKNPGHPAHHQLIVNPHAAFYSEEGLMEIRRRSMKAFLDVL
jgi:C-terminal binding protein